MAERPLLDIVIGAPEAPITIFEYASLACAHCAAFHNASLPDLKAGYIDTGIAKLVIREFPFDPQGLASFMLRRCVGSEKRRAVIEHLFAHPHWAWAQSGSQSLFDVAKQTGMTHEAFVACLKNMEMQGSVLPVKEHAGRELGVQSTPTFFIEGTRYVGAMSAN